MRSPSLTSLPSASTAAHAERRRAGVLVTLGCVLFSAMTLAAQQTNPQWIWNAPAASELWLRRSYTVDAAAAAKLRVSCDNRFELWLDGKRIGSSAEWAEVSEFSVPEAGSAGAHSIAVRAKNDGGPAGLALRLTLRSGASPATRDIVSDAAWKLTTRAPVDAAWTQTNFDDSSWAPATPIARVGAEDAPWSSQVDLGSFGLTQPAGDKIDATQQPRPAEIKTLDGFVAERIYDVPKRYGSWVALCTGPDGDLFASDERGKGIYRITPAARTTATATTVRRIDVDIGGVQGLCWAFDSLYAVANGKQSGLWKIDLSADTPNAQLLQALRGSGEHGPHAVVLSPDGAALYVVAGNHTALPMNALRGSRLPINWAEDQLLPRQWDARGHARGRLAPGGWICRVTPDGQDWELHAAGFRNAFDIAFDQGGEMFTWDSDMEWDMGMPWYRPTRICHVVSGAEFGWRAGSGKWPADAPDAVPPVLDMGPASPTGLVFGSGAKFPQRYRRALFALDWTFGTIWAVHTQPAGASFSAEAEEFVAHTPLPVTDAVVGADGALYFSTGGRGTASSLYRVRYAPEANAEVADAAIVNTTAVESPAASAAVTLRRELERFHGPRSFEAPDQAWEALASDDRAVRYAARLALEAQPLTMWTGKRQQETNPRRLSHALLAWARSPDDDHDEQGRAWNGEFDRLLRRSDLSTADLRVALRAAAVRWARRGSPSSILRPRLLHHLDALYPHADAGVNHTLIELLVFLNAPTLAARAVPTLAEAQPADLSQATPWARRLVRNATYGKPIARMLAAAPPAAALHTAFALRTLSTGWTPELRKDYFAFLQRAEGWSGGSSYRGFIQTARREALSQCSQETVRALGVLSGVPAQRPAPTLPTIDGPARDWTVDGALKVVEKRMRKRDFARGRALFWATSCIACHRFDGEGGAIGPDLTTAGHRFSDRDLLTAILQPSDYISDQYGSSTVISKDGARFSGRVIASDDGSMQVYTADPRAAPIAVAAADVQSVETSPISQMPAGLINHLSEDQLADLIAYLRSSGDSKGRGFRR